MGAWGTSLYANDSASDIRGEYVDKLRRGKSNEEATKALIEQNQDYMGDAEEEPLFWYALADTQWNYGRLLPEVKEKALHFLDCIFIRKFGISTRDHFSFRRNKRITACF